MLQSELAFVIGRHDVLRVGECDLRPHNRRFVHGTQHQTGLPSGSGQHDSQFLLSRLGGFNHFGSRCQALGRELQFMARSAAQTFDLKRSLVRGHDRQFAAGHSDAGFRQRRVRPTFDDQSRHRHVADQREVRLDFWLRHGANVGGPSREPRRADFDLRRNAGNALQSVLPFGIGARAIGRTRQHHVRLFERTIQGFVGDSAEDHRVTFEFDVELRHVRIAQFELPLLRRETGSHDLEHRQPRGRSAQLKLALVIRLGDQLGASDPHFGRTQRRVINRARDCSGNLCRSREFEGLSLPLFTGGQLFLLLGSGQAFRLGHDPCQSRFGLFEDEPPLGIAARALLAAVQRDQRAGDRLFE